MRAQYMKVDFLFGEAGLKLFVSKRVPNLVQYVIPKEGLAASPTNPSFDMTLTIGLESAYFTDYIVKSERVIPKEGFGGRPLLV